MADATVSVSGANVAAATKQTGAVVLDLIKKFVDPAVIGPFTMAIGAAILVSGIAISISAIMGAVQVTDGRAPGGVTIGSKIIKFFVGVILVTIGGQMMASGTDYGQIKVFGTAWDTVYKSQSVVQISPVGDNELSKESIDAIVKFVSFIGVIALVRGVFLFGRHADGDRDALARGITFFIAGMVASNFGAFLEMIEATFHMGLWVAS